MAQMYRRRVDMSQAPPCLRAGNATHTKACISRGYQQYDYGNISIRCRGEVPVEWDHGDSSRTCHIRHARCETTACPSGHSAVVGKIGSTTLVDMVRCLGWAWICFGSSHPGLCTKLLSRRFRRGGSRQHTEAHRTYRSSSGLSS